jgi:hypothetical protein
VPGRFPLYTVENVKGALIKALRQAGWDVLRALDVFAEGTDDDTHLDYAVKANRALVTNDQPMQATAHERLSQGKAIPRVIGWPQEKYKRATVAAVVQKFEQLAETDEPFNPDYPIIYL